MITTADPLSAFLITIDRLFFKCLIAHLSAGHRFCLPGWLSCVLGKLNSLMDSIVSTIVGVLPGTKSDFGLKFLYSKGPKFDLKTVGRIGCLEGPGFLALVCFCD